MNKVIFVLWISIFFISCSQNRNDSQDQPTESLEQIKEDPDWVPFETCLDNCNGYIYTNIKIDSDINSAGYINSDGYFLVWVKYEWNDSTKIPSESKNIKIRKDCYSFDYNFLKIGDVAHYEFLRNGKPINSEELRSPDWSYIIPFSEGSNIAQAVIKILEKRYPFNRTANRLYRHEKYKTVYDED